jgi:hypothetical protein
MAALRIFATGKPTLRFAPGRQQKFIGFICVVKHAVPRRFSIRE